MQIKRQVVDRLMSEVAYSGDLYKNASAIAHVFVNRVKVSAQILIVLPV